jgi:hypothetical protein
MVEHSAPIAQPDLKEAISEVSHSAGGWVYGRWVYGGL